MRSLVRTLPLAPGGWRVKVVSGSLGPPGAPENAATFFGDVTHLVPVPYDEAARSAAPQAAWIPMHPSYEERPGAPDRVFAALDDATAEYLISAWERILGAEGVLDDVTIAHVHHLTPAHAAIARLAPQLPRVTHLHRTELLMLEAIERGAAWPYGMAWRERMREWAHASTWLIAATVDRGRRRRPTPRRAEGADRGHRERDRSNALRTAAVVPVRPAGALASVAR